MLAVRFQHTAGRVPLKTWPVGHSLARRYCLRVAAHRVLVLTNRHFSQDNTGSDERARARRVVMRCGIRVASSVVAFCRRAGRARPPPFW